ncbi:MAG TPA: protein translocase subunit SecDF [Chryseolinea sp.]|nr:protein translocase subunit SecDF [Chryseolinea sp.]
MQNKGFVISLTVVITLLCVYYLSFTVVSHRVNSDAEEFSTDAKGIVNSNKKQVYLDSIRDKPVYNFFGLEYTFKEVQDNELNLGLDLQGGMHVTLEVSPVDIIKGLAGNTSDSTFLKALYSAQMKSRKDTRNFSVLFYEAYQQSNSKRSLASMFTHASTRGRITSSSTDKEVMDMVNEEIDKAIDRSYTILQNRLDKFGTSSANIQQLPGTGRIQVEVPGIDNPDRVRKLLQGVAHLEFWDVTEPSTLNSQLMAINELLVKEQKAQGSKATTTTPDASEDLSSLLTDSAATAPAQDSTKAKGLDSLQNSAVAPLFALSTPPGAFRYALTDTAQINKIFKRSDIAAILRNVKVFWAYKTEKDQLDNEALQLHFIDVGRDAVPKLSGDVINEARLSTDEYARPAVSMTMNVAGSRIWAKMTRDASSKNPRGRIAILLDNSVYSAPGVNGEIPNGNSQISGNFSIEEAKDLANILQAGSLPAPCTIVEEAIIGPTLGQSAKEAGFISSACGLILVVMFMVAYYSRGGWIANFALLFNIFFILGILAQPSFSTALTLPGIAGIVLTMGMAVDANVLIYERIKEEVDKGKTLVAAVQSGFKRAFASIFDSNLTALITGIFLFLFGQGPIKGFAITLIIGIVTSFFTAIYISRLVIEWMMSRTDHSKISFETPISRLIKRRKYFEFISKSKMVFIASNTVVVIGFILILINGLNLGVDFKGGRSFVVTFNKPIEATDMKVSLTEGFEGAGTEVKNYGGNNIMKITTSYQIEDNSEEADTKVRSTLITNLEKFSGSKYAGTEGSVDENHFTISSSSKVGATVADDIKESAWKASLLSLLGIFVYILFRFNKWQYSLGAIIATVHDALFVFAAFAIADLFGISFEIDQIFVASILTVIGYSINDTVIIFDRIRENMAMGYTSDRKRIVNDALNDTLSRTIITSGTTIIVVLVLLIFGGEVLRGFSFALLVGVMVGTYSSIYIAAPTVLIFDKKKTLDKTDKAAPKKVQLT